jgi:hypothetical protein
VRKVEENMPFGKYANAAWDEQGAGGLRGIAGRRGRGWAGWAKSDAKKSFLYKNLIFEYSKALEICTRRFFLNSSRLLKYFRKMKYAMPCYVTLGKIN